MIKCLITIQIELEFGNVGSREEGKTGELGEKTSLSKDTLFRVFDIASQTIYNSRANSKQTLAKF